MELERIIDWDSFVARQQDPLQNRLACRLGGATFPFRPSRSGAADETTRLNHAKRVVGGGAHAVGRRGPEA